VADMVVADIDFPCGRYGFLLWPISSCCGRYGLWPIWSHPDRASQKTWTKASGLHKSITLNQIEI